MIYKRGIARQDWAKKMAFKIHNMNVLTVLSKLKFLGREGWLKLFANYTAKLNSFKN